MSSECILPQGKTHALYTRSISAILEVYAFQDTLISEPVAKMYSGWSFMEKCTVGVQWVELYGNYTIQHTLKFSSCSALALASLQTNARNKQLLHETEIVRTHCYL